MNSRFKSAWIAAAALAVGLAACKGPAGGSGAAGTNGTNGNNGTNGTDGMSAVTSGLQISVVGVSANSDGTNVAVRFTLKDDQGQPVDPNGVYSLNAPFQPRFSLSYIPAADTNGNVPAYKVLTTSGSSTSTPAYAQQPTAFAPAFGSFGTPKPATSGTLVENGTGNGDFTYTFPTGGDVVGSTSTTRVAPTQYDPTKLSNTHVVWIQASRQTDLTYANDTRTFKAANQEYDYVPAGGTPSRREIVKTANCSKCHNGFKPPDRSVANAFHGGGRVEGTYCNVCHNPDRLNAAANSSVFIHRIHGSGSLQATNLFHGIKVTYPQDIRNCDACHGGALQGAQWKTNPSRAACGSCHDYVDFTGSKTPTCADPVTTDANGLPIPCNHAGGAQADDSGCTGCHSSNGVASRHVPVLPPDPNSTYAGGTNSRTNAAYVAAAGVVPAGASRITYDVSRVSAYTDTSVTPNVKRPQIVFKLKKDGTDVNFGTYDATSNPELIPNFVGSPSVYFAFAVTQDGITVPADFNASTGGYIKNIWNGSATGTGAGTITGPDGSGYYTITLTGVVVPDGARMLTGGVGYTYDLGTTQPLTQTNVAGYVYNAATKVGGLIVPAQDVWRPANAQDARRAIVSTARCNGCHVQLGVAPSFHVGQRNDGPTCSFCHNPNRTSSGWSANASTFIHGIHAGTVAGVTLPGGTVSTEATGIREVPFNWHAVSATQGFWDVTFPGGHNNCQACHEPGTYDFSASASAAAVPNLLWSTVATGILSPGYSVSPYVTTGTDYGTGFSFSAGTGATTQAQATTLVTSPIAAACVACHDSPAVRAHMIGNGGTLYAPRTAMATNVEQCLICHGQASLAPIGILHQ